MDMSGLRKGNDAVFINWAERKRRQRWMSITEAADLLCISRAAMAKRVARGWYDTRKRGNKIEIKNNRKLTEQ